MFIEPPRSGVIHCNQSDSKLQLQVDIFCEDICAGVEDWATQVLAYDRTIQARMAELLVVHSARNGLSF